MKQLTYSARVDSRSRLRDWHRSDRDLANIDRAARWCRENFSTGRFYVSRNELCLYFEHSEDLAMFVLSCEDSHDTYYS